ncbi:MAG: alpha/beta fold hydrolase, partial [Planctomycetaceae bacterium]
VHNGVVVKNVALRKERGKPAVSNELQFEVVPKRSGWVAARALYRAPDGLLRQAHTSPIYFAVDGKPIAFADDARYMLKWIEQLTALAADTPDRFPTEDAKQKVLETYAEAKLKYEDVISNSIQIMKWRDLFGREKPKPDATISYGEHELQVVDVWKPAGQGSAPAIIMIHGGCWQTEIAERDIMNWIADDLRQHGVGVWNIEYRGVDRDGGFPGTYEDVAKAADLFREKAVEFGFLTTKTIAIGHSAGGHLALWLGNRPAIPESETIRGENPIKIDLAVSQGGLPDLRAGANRDGHPCGVAAPFQMMGSERRLTQITSPSEMKPGQARQVLFHNTLDRIAPPKFARAYIDQVRSKNVGVTLIETEAEGHVELVAPDSKSWARQRALILRELGLK